MSVRPPLFRGQISTAAGEDINLPIDIKRTKNGFQYAYPPYDRRLIDGVILHILQTGDGGLILRSFLDEKDKKTGLPFKEISGWFLNPTGKDLASTIVRLPANQLKVAHATNGKLLPIEPSVRFR